MTYANRAILSQAERLARLAATVAPGGTILMTPAAAIQHGDMLLAPCVHAARIARTDSGVTITSDINTVHAFAPDRWLPLLRPADPTVPCPGCGGTWLQGCADDCDARTLLDEDVADALTGTPASAPTAKPPTDADLVAGITALMCTAQAADFDPVLALARACKHYYDQLGPDRLDELTRADWAYPAAEVYAAMNFSAPLADLACEEALGDLVADVGHLADRYEVDPAEVLCRGERYFTEEQAETDTDSTANGEAAEPPAATTGPPATAHAPARD